MGSLEGLEGWTVETLNSKLTGLGFRWWKGRAMKAVEQRELRPLSGQKDVLALGYPAIRKAWKCGPVWKLL